MGMVPFQVDADNRHASFIRAGAARFTDPFFDMSLAKVAGAGAVTIELTYAELREIVGHELPSPRAVVFHTGRCGSTLLTRMLAHDRQTLVVSEPESLSAVVQHTLFQPGFASDDGRALLDLLVVLDRFTAARKQRVVMKAPSWQSLYSARWAELLPEAPVVFVHRPPAEVVASELAGPPAWLKWVRRQFETDPATMSLWAPLAGALPSGATDVEVLAAMWASSASAALELPRDRTIFVGYGELLANPAGVLAHVATHIGVAGSVNEVTALSELRYYAKGHDPAEPYDALTTHARPPLAGEELKRVHEIVGDLPNILASRHAPEGVCE
jgi:hypothetical protein